EHPEWAEDFNAAMSGFTGRATQAMLDDYDLSGVGTLADGGGGVGSNLARIRGSALGRPGGGFLGCSGQEVLGVASGMDDLPRNAHALSSGQKYRTLLAVAEAILSHRDLHALFHDLTDRLQQVVRFDYLILVLHDAANNTMRRHILETSDPSP